MRVEYAGARRMRERNKRIYRFAHWPIWIAVFFLVPGPLIFNLFERGGDTRSLLWLAFVLIATGCAGVAGQLPGVEPKPYILRFTEDRPNPLYRRICYTFAWADIVTFAVLNLAGLAIAVATGTWYLKQIYQLAYFPFYALILLLGAAGILPRVRSSTKGEGTERRYFYGSVWAVTFGQIVLMIFWKLLPRGHAADIAKLAIYASALIAIGFSARLGLLPRTRPIVPGEMIVAD